MSHLRLALAFLLCGTAWGAAPSYSADWILSVGSYARGPFAPNSLISIYGSDLARGTQGLTAADIKDNRLPVKLDVTQVLIEAEAVPLFYVSEKQINLLIPARAALGKAELQVIREGQRGPVVIIEIGAAAPALFIEGGYAIAVHGADVLSLVSADKPARPGELIVLYAAGLGKAEAMPATGELVVFLSRLANAFRVTVNGAAVDPARVLYAGLTPASAGLYQVNFYLPENCGPDPEVRLFVGDSASPAGVKLAVR